MIQDILKNCTIEGMVVKLPTGQLDRAVYLETKKKLELIGGKWKGGKTQGFVFEEDPSELLGAVANGDDRNLKKEYQFFATPTELAKRMVDVLPGTNGIIKVLEPSAGDGALIKAFLNNYSHPEQTVDCYEAMDLNRVKLNKLDRVKIRGNDFLECTNKENYYDIIIANPPFTKHQDIDHIMKMYEVCKPGGTIVTLASPSWRIGSNKKQVAFNDWVMEHADVEEIPEGTFKESGTNIRTVLLKIVKPESDGFSNPCTPKNFQEQANEFVKNRQAIKTVRTCRICGCTDDNCIQCIEKTGSPCHWIEGDLCSACLDVLVEKSNALPEDHSDQLKQTAREFTADDEPEEILKSIVENHKEVEKHLIELQKMISPENNNDMNFFQQLFEQLDGIDLTLNIKRKNGKITLSVLPQTAGVISPALITGTPAELDEGFFDAVKAPIQEAKGLNVSLANLEASIKTAKEKKEADLKEASKAVKKDTAKPAEKSSAKGKKDAAKKPEKEVEKAEAPVPDLFANV
ncbi:MAG TPA: PRTRC system protein E [Hanamia sp.]|nr:PRTRC system protein E [Hanamia sp.]